MLDSTRLISYNKRNILNRHIIISTISILAMILASVLFFPVAGKHSYILTAAGISLFLSFNSKYVYSIQILALFTPLYLLSLHASVFMSLLVLFSCTITGKRIDASILKSPLNKFLAFYLFALFISLANTISIIGSLTRMINYFSFILLIILTQILYTESKKGIYQIYLFLSVTLINSFYIIFSYAGRRNFGFMNILFVDFVAMGFLLMIVLFFYTRKFKIITLSFAMVLGIAMILTQTRNVWISFALAFVTIMAMFFIKNTRLYIKRNHVLIFCAFFAILFSIVIFSSESLTESTSKRMENLTEVDPQKVEQGDVGNSLVTRLFIWHTCYNAFTHHPILGIGAYSFPFTSKYYYTLPKIFYSYIDRLTPHETFIAVLTETGIIGFIAFMILIFAIVKLIIRIFRLSSTYEDIRFSMVLISGNIYIFYSMLFTDAWLWGQQMMIWGIFLGLLLSHFNFLKKNIETNNE